MVEVKRTCLHFSCHQLPLVAQGPYCDAPQGSVFPETPVGVFPIISRLYLPVPPSRHQCAASLWEWPALQNSWASPASISRENNAPCQGDTVRETEENLVPKGATHDNGCLLWGRHFWAGGGFAGFVQPVQLAATASSTVRSISSPTHSLHINISFYHLSHSLKS